MESWGCEYLDIERHQEFKVLKKDYIYVPMSVMDEIVDQKVSRETFRKDQQYIANLMYDIGRHGLKTPAEITIGQNSIILSDGNHRYIACRELGHDKFPVTIKISDTKLKLDGIKIKDIFIQLLETYE